MLEIGVRQGGSTRALLHAAEVNDGHLQSIDIDDCSAALPEELKARRTFRQGDTRQMLAELLHSQDKTYDLVYVDGEHTKEAVAAELAALDLYVVPGGVIVLDDCWHAFPGVLEAFLEFQSIGVESKSLIQYGTSQSYMGLDRALGVIRF